MPKTDTVRQVDLPRTTSGGTTYVRSGSSGGGSNADTVDGYHASSTRTAGKLLALDGSARFPASVIDFSALMHNDLGGLTVGNPHTQYVNAATGGITKTGQSVALSASVAGDGLALAAGVLSVNVGTGIKITTDAVALDTHTHQTAAQGGTLDHGLALTGLADDDHPQYALLLPMLTSRNVVQAGAADVTPLTLKGAAAQSAALWQVLDSTGTALIRVNQAGDLESAGFQSGIRGWRVDHEGTAEFQNAYVRGELHATVFVKDLIEAHAGTLGIFKSGGKLHADFTTPAVGATAALTITDPPGGGFLFTTGDWVRIKAEHASGVYDVWGQVTLPVDNGDGTQSYTYTHRSGTVGAVIPAGVAVADYGASGQGYILATADLNYAPYLDVASWAGANPYTGSNHTAHVRLGQLQGITGASEYGLWAGGTYAGLTGQRYLKASTAGLTIYGLPQTWVNAAGNVRGQVLPDATGTDPLFWLGPSSADKRLTVRADGVVLFGSVPSTTLDGWRYGSTTTIDGGKIAADTVTASSLLAHGANTIDNPGFEAGTLAGWKDPAADFTVITGTTVHSHSGSCFGRATASGTTRGVVGQEVRVLPGRNYYVGLWVRAASATPADETGVVVYWRDGTGANISYDVVYVNISSLWQLASAVLRAPVNAASAYLHLYHGSGITPTVYVQYDDVEFYLADGLVMVGSPTGARVQISPDGLEGYDSSGTRQFRIRTSDGVGAFGPSGKESLISAGGLRLYGGEASWTDFSAIRWLTNPGVLTGGRVASVGGGLYYGGTAPSLQMIANPNGDYATSSLSLRANASTANEYSVMEMRGGPTYGGTWTMSGLHSGAINWSFTAGYGEIDMSILGTQQMLVNATGLVPRAINWWGGPLNREQTLNLTGYGTGTYVWVRVRTQQDGPGERVRQFSVYRSVHQDGTWYGQLAAIISGATGRYGTLSGQGFVTVHKAEKGAALLIEARIIEDAAVEPYSGIYLKLLGGRNYTFHGVDAVTVYGTGTPTGGTATHAVPVSANGAISMYAANMYFKVDGVFDVEGVVRASTRFDRGTNQGVSGNYGVVTGLPSLTTSTHFIVENVTGVSGLVVTRYNRTYVTGWSGGSGATHKFDGGIFIGT